MVVRVRYAGGDEVDAALWGLAAVLFALALWFGRPQDRAWDIRWMYLAIQGALRGEQPPAEGEATPAPSRWLGVGCRWENLSGDPSVEAALERRFKGVKLVWTETPAVEITGLEVVILPGRGAPCAGAAQGALPPHPAEEPLEALLKERHTRLVLAARTEADAILKLLHAAPGLRDRVRAVLLVGPQLDQDWLSVHFNHREMDTELARRTPYIVLRVSPDADAQRLPEPPELPTGRMAVEIADLGVVGEAEVQETGRALGLLLAALG